MPYNKKSLDNLRPPIKKGEKRNPKGSSAKSRKRAQEKAEEKRHEKYIDSLLNEILGPDTISKIEAQGDPMQSYMHWLERILMLPLKDYKQLVNDGKDGHIPLAVLNAITALQADMNNGKTTTLDNIHRRLYGDIQRKMDVTTDGQPINTPRTLTTKEAAAMFAALEAEYKATDREDEEEAEQPKETPSEATETPIS